VSCSNCGSDDPLYYHGIVGDVSTTRQWWDTVLRGGLCVHVGAGGLASLRWSSGKHVEYTQQHGQPRVATLYEDSSDTAGRVVKHSEAVALLLAAYNAGAKP